MSFFKIDEELVEAAQVINNEEAKSFTTPSALYPVVINVAYVTESSTSEAVAMTIEYTAEGWKYPKRESMWFRGANGAETRMAKKRDGTEYPDETFGHKQIKGLCEVLGLDRTKLETTEGVIKTKDGQKTVQVFAGLTGKVLTVGLQETLEDKYGDESESRSVSNMIWVGRDDKDEAGVVFPWGRTQSAAKAQEALDKTPIKDERELSKPGATGGDDASEAFSAFGQQ